MDAESNNTETQLVKQRRRMRGIATFFIIVSVIAILGIIVLLASDNAVYTDADLYSRLALVVGCFFGAIAAWHSSRVGAVSVVLVQSVSPLLGLIGAEQLNAAEYSRSLLYVALSLFMTVSAFRYVSLSDGLDRDIGGSAVVRWIGKSVNASIVAFFGLGVAALANGTTIKVLKGSEISEQHLQWLSEKEFLFENEKPLYFYMDGVFSIDEGGSLLTDQYVGGWWQENNQLQSSWVKLGEICKVEQTIEGSWWEDAVYRVHGPGEESWVELWLSVEENVHTHFISRMKSINNRLMTPEVQKFCDEGRPIDWQEIAAMNGISSEVVGPDQVSESQKQWLRENDYLMEDETMLHFFSYGQYSIEEGGVLLTDVYFGGWYKIDGEPGAYWGELGKLCSITRLDDTAGETRVLYKVVASDDGGIQLSLPKAGAGVDQMIAQTLTLNDAAMTDEAKTACAALAEESSEN
ncbi:MAG: hypothetical protein HRT81_15370 [Henriciella sp.]|nr:hypothetical protein [Henriciella sp.]